MRIRLRAQAAAWVLLGLAGLSAACGRGTTGPATSSEPGVIFRDDFSATTSGWDKHTGPDLTTDYDNGRYLIGVEEPGVDVYATPGLELADVAIEAQTQYVAGPVNNEYGLICRYARGGDGRRSFYFFFISSDGYYALGKVVKDQRAILSPPEGSFQPSAAINVEPDAANHLSATCQGDRFSFSINGTPAGEFSDTDLPRGDVGLIVGTFDEGGVRIHFDDVVVRQP